jgi:hypothetical protein
MKSILCFIPDLQARDAGSRFVSILPPDDDGGGVEKFIRGGVEQLFILLQRSRREHYNLISLQGRSASSIHILFFSELPVPIRSKFSAKTHMIRKIADQ